MNEKEFDRLLCLYLDGKLSTEEIVALKDAVQTIPAYRHRFQSEIRLHTLLREVTAERIEEKRITKTNQRRYSAGIPRRKPILRYLMAAAAAFAIVGMIHTILTMETPPISIGTCLHVTSDGQLELIRGQQVSILSKNQQLFKGDRILNSQRGKGILFLKDGSMITLEGNTELVLPKNGDMQITLQRGQIELEVTKRKPGKAPFRVRTPHSVITVLGTIFTVKAETDSTQLNVSRGKVQFERSEDNRQVFVEANQFAVTSDPLLEVCPIEEPETLPEQTEIVELLPTDDVVIQRGVVLNRRGLRIEKGTRVAYLRFHLQDIGPAEKAVLQLSQANDTGNGTLSFYLGDHADWTEKTIKVDAAPRPATLLATRTGRITRDSVIEIDLSKGIKDDGTYTIVIMHSQSGSQDVCFSSKEGPAPPVLILTK